MNIDIEAFVLNWSQFRWYNLLQLHDLINLDNEGNKIAGDEDPWFKKVAKNML